MTPLEEIFDIALTSAQSKYDLGNVEFQRAMLVAIKGISGGGGGGGGDVNLTQLNGATISVGAGASGTGVQRVALANDVPLPGGELHLGEVGSHTRIVGVTFSFTAGAQTAGTLLAETQTISGAFRKADGTGILQTMTFNDKDDNGPAFKVVLLDVASTMGTENSAVTISDGNADNILAVFDVATTDWTDLGGTKVCTIRNIGIPIKSIAGAATIAIALVNGSGTPTVTSSGMTARLGILCD